MKKIRLTLLVVFSLFIVCGVRAQTKDYFAGKWEMTFYATPYGDVKRIFILERKDGKLGGIIQDTTGKELSKVTKVSETEKSAAIDFTAEGYDVTLNIDPVDDDHVKGNIAGFDAKGVRRKEEH